MFAKLLSSMLLLAASLLATGCARDIPDAPGGDKNVAKGKGKGKHVHVHGEWWCDEHGVPEEVCARCKPELVAEFKQKKDWCDKHDRPRSQCFVCEPKLFERFAAQYVAKYGKKPPQPTE
ncbi:MAG: RND transporter [Planctomycetes bacterium]|nr:RND transporter [Planctomycetota bacterium]